MHPFLLYLITINIVAFLAFVIDFVLCLWKPEITAMYDTSFGVWDGQHGGCEQSAIC